MADKVEFLKQHPLFEYLSEDQVEALATIAAEREYENEAVVAYQGDVADRLYIVKSGRLYAETRKPDEEENLLVTESKQYLPGDFFGADWLFEPSAHPATIIATYNREEPVRLITIRSTNFLRFLNRHPGLLPQLEPEYDTTDEWTAGLTPLAWEEAQKLMAKADRKSAAISILPDELVEYTSRRSIWYLFVRLAGPLGSLLLVPTLLYFFLNSQPDGSFLYRLRLVIPNIFAVFFFAFVLFRFLDWTNDYFVITNRRLVHREFDLRTFRIDIKTARINQVQSVEIAKPTFISNLFNFGTARITTASQHGTILFDNIDDPVEVKQTLDRLSRYVKTLDASREQTLMRQSLQNHFTVPSPYETIGSEAEQIEASPVKRTFRERLRQRYKWRVEEEGVITYRKHVLVLLIDSAIPISLAVAGLIVGFMLWRYFEFTLNQLAPGFLLYFALVFLWLIWRIEDWRNDTFQLTDRLVVDIDRKPFGFGESRKQAMLDNIQNVNAYTPDIVHTIFNFGNVEIETAGEESNLVFENVPFPSAIQSDIFQQLEEFQEQQRRSRTSQRHKEFSLLIDVYKQSEEQELIPRRTPREVPPPEPD